MRYHRPLGGFSPRRVRTSRYDTSAAGQAERAFQGRLLEARQAGLIRSITTVAMTVPPRLTPAEQAYYSYGSEQARSDLHIAMGLIEPFEPPPKHAVLGIMQRALDARNQSR